MVDTVVMTPPSPNLRNPGPSWGFAFLLWAERWWPGWLFRPALMAGTWVGLAFMPAQRAASREYLTIVLRRPPRLVEIWEHFFAFAEFLILKLRAARGVEIQCVMGPHNRAEFEALADQLADQFVAFQGADAPPLSNYAVIREGIDEATRHPPDPPSRRHNPL